MCTLAAEAALPAPPPPINKHRTIPDKSKNNSNQKNYGEMLPMKIKK
jgi:hypothetical protein